MEVHNGQDIIFEGLIVHSAALDGETFVDLSGAYFMW